MIVTSNKKIIFAKIIPISSEFHSERGYWTRPKIPWHKIIGKICETHKVEDTKHFMMRYLHAKILDITF